MSQKRIRLFAKGIPVIVLCILATIFLQTQCKNSQVNIFNTALILFFCVAGQYIMLGLGGMLWMCSISIMGLSAFVCGFLNTKCSVPILFAMLAGTLAAGIVSFILGALLLKLEGRAFVFGTMGCVYIFSSIFQNCMPFTGGPNGTSGIEKIELFGYRLATFKQWVPFLIAIAVLLVLLLYRIKNTSMGRALMAVRDDATAAQTMGVNVYRTKIIAFTFAGLLAGIGGGFYAAHNGVISAALFTYATQTKLIIMLMLGGVMSPIGALFGTILVNYLPEIARVADQYLNLLYGIMIIIMMIFMPMGLAGLWKALRQKISKWMRGKLTLQREAEL